MRVLIADDHDLVRETLVLFLQSQDGIEAEGARDLGEALARMGSGMFDIVLLDYNMPGMDGLDGLARALAAPGATRVALMSGTAPREVAEEALALGAAGFLPKTLQPRTLCNAVRFMASGEVFAPVELFTAPVAPEPTPHPLTGRLTPREMQVLTGLTAGKANKEIARDIGLTEPTVKLHIKTLYRKLGVANRTQAAMIARDEGLA